MPKDSHDKFIAQKADIEILAVAITLLGRRASKNKSDPSQAIQVCHTDVCRKRRLKGFFCSTAARICISTECTFLLV